MATWPEQQPGTNGEDIRSIQYLLNAHGADLSVDGDFGPLTKAAVEHFQGLHGLAVDGIVGNQTWPALIVLVQSGATGPAVQAVQSQIDSRVDILVVDGDFGPQTDSAVGSFQGTIGLTVDGIVGPLTWNALINGFLSATGGSNAAQLAFQAWTQNDEASARKNATPQAVSQLFAQSWAANTWTFEGCGAAAGSVYCTWNKATGHLQLQANDDTGAPFYYVVSATFQ
jgi:peptidoglycan hydrolase-like protein with peptidoglycan-binding domain